MSILVKCSKKDFSSLLFLINGWCRNIVCRHVVNLTHNAPFVKTYAIKISVLLHLVFLCLQERHTLYKLSTETFHLDLKCQVKNGSPKHWQLNLNFGIYTVLYRMRRCFSSIFSPPESPGIVPGEANPLTDVTSRCWAIR